jgi:YidC/Oxa1 family membrane protein insertase
LLNFLYIAISWVLLRWHDLFKTFLDPTGGLSWALSIFMLVVTIRLLLFRFFIKQVHSQRKMQEVQPKIAALREKYKNDRQTLSQEMMKLQKEEGFNPLSGCLPILAQAPVFISLFHVLRVAANENGKGALVGEYHWTPAQAEQAEGAKLFGAPIAAAFRTATERIVDLGGTVGATRVVAGLLIVLMVAATYITQRQIISRTSQTQVIDGQQAMIQKLLLYGMPASLFVSGFLFPIGVLLYWFTNNLWTMGQQFYILKRMPHPTAKKDERDPAVVKALAPKPGQKPVRPERRPATVTSVDGDGTAPDAAAPDGAAPDGRTGGGKATTPKAGARPAAGKTRGTAAAGKGGGATVNGADGAKADGAAADGAATGSGASPADGTGGSDDGGTPSGTPAAPRGKPGAGRPSGGGRRPPGQRSPTQTRQKKKRR